MSIVAILASDNVLFWLSTYRTSKFVGKLIRKIKKNKINYYKQLMKKHVGKTIFLLKFFAGLRAFGPFLAGSTKVKWKIFQFYNLLAVLVYVPLFVFLGYHFHNRLALIITEVELARHIIFLLMMGVLGSFLMIFIRKKFLVKS